jgi:hypothetical protein
MDLLTCRTRLIRMVLVCDCPAFLRFVLRYLPCHLSPLRVKQRAACRRHWRLDGLFLGALHEGSRVFGLDVAADLLRFNILLLLVLHFRLRLV